jgi:hypothetical protein
MKAANLKSAVETVTSLFAKYQTDHQQIFLDAINNLHEVVEANILKITEKQERRRSTEQRIHAIVEQFTETGTIRYYYAPGSNSFVACDGVHYTIVREDDVIAAVLRVLQTEVATRCNETNQGQLVDGLHTRLRNDQERC